MNNYEYRSLDPEAHEIRLLKVQKSSDESAPITLDLRHASLEDGKLFYALSYTWGDETPTTQIAIRDGVTPGFVSVRRNLFEYLREARRSTQDWSSEWIWIDQISINQEDQDEKGHQVGQMRKLYSITKATLVWPWSWSKNSLEAVKVFLADCQVDHNQWICNTSELLASAEECCDIWSHVSWKRRAVDLLRRLTYGQYMQAIETPYWERLWIIQEFVLAPSCYIILNGTSWTPEQFEWVMRGITSMVMRGIDPSRRETLKNLHDFERYREMKKSTEIFSWDQVLHLSKDACCTKPLDRVYGVMGLVHESLHVLPDYSISGMELLRRVLSTVSSTTQPYGRWWDIYKILLVWRFSEFQFVGTQWDVSLANYKSEGGFMHHPNWLANQEIQGYSKRNSKRNSLDRRSRRKIKRVVRQVLTELGIHPPPLTYRGVQIRFIFPLQAVVSDPGIFLDHFKDRYHLQEKYDSFKLDCWFLRKRMLGQC